MDQIDVLIPEEKIATRICELADEINKEYAGKEIRLVVILKGSVFFACELAKHITVPLTLDFMEVSSYGDGMVSAGKITVKKELDEDIHDKHVLIVEDIVDSGVTLSNLKKLLLARNPASLKIVTLLDKPERRVTDIETDWCGFEISDKFVVGYGLDYAQKYRNLQYIGVLKLD
ncbi:MAG: hypoxanthine phosphoribosyltransferase [Lachnospiraceae bacterium]